MKTGRTSQHPSLNNLRWSWLYEFCILMASDQFRWSKPKVICWGCSFVFPFVTSSLPFLMDNSITWSRISLTKVCNLLLTLMKNWSHWTLQGSCYRISTSFRLIKGVPFVILVLRSLIPMLLPLTIDASSWVTVACSTYCKSVHLLRASICMPCLGDRWSHIWLFVQSF